MKKRAARAAKVRRTLVLVFGEHDHDRRAIVHLATGLRPDLRGRFEVRRAPLVLIKNASPSKAKENAVRIAEVARQESSARDILAVLAHEDCDSVEPAHVSAAEKIEKTLAAAGCPGTPVGVTPAWEIEAWWLVFPDAVGPLVKGWREPTDWIGRDVGQLTNAKEKLVKAVRPMSGGAKPRDYREADSIEIARNIADRALLASFDGDVRSTHRSNGATERTRSASFGAFRRKMLGLPALPPDVRPG